MRGSAHGSRSSCSSCSIPRLRRLRGGRRRGSLPLLLHAPVPWPLLSPPPSCALRAVSCETSSRAPMPRSAPEPVAPKAASSTSRAARQVAARVLETKPLRQASSLPSCGARCARQARRPSQRRWR
eukprot:5704363-Prymnesium_polylepis.1